jgi:integrase
MLSDLRALFAVIDKPLVDVSTADVLEFIAERRRPRGDGRVVRLSDGESGRSARTIKGRLSSISGLFTFLVMVGEASANPVPRGLSTRRSRGKRGLLLIRTPRTLPNVVEPGEVDAFIGPMRRWRDRAMVEAMLLGGLRHCEVLGFRFEELRAGERRVFIVEGKGGELMVRERSSHVRTAERGRRRATGPAHRGRRRRHPLRTRRPRPPSTVNPT